jgi:uncharacterized membrane protein YdjX (TVP38/TMEM64 family)
MTSPAHLPESSSATKGRSRRFGLRHVVALLFAIAIPVLIFVFRDQVRDFERLGYVGAFLAMLIGNATVVLPVPGLLFVFAMGHTYEPLALGLAAGAGGALGELVGYMAGYSASGYVETTSGYRRVERWVRRGGPAAIAFLAAIPNPLFDVVGLAAGALGIGWRKFLLAAWVGKTVQGVAIAFAGRWSIGWIEQLLK